MTIIREGRSGLTARRLREVLDYDLHAGVFQWKVKSGRAKRGDIAGSRTNGYVEIGLDKESYRAHRLAWFYVFGKWPIGDLDHRDTVRHHNWISNLRPATRSQNLANSRRKKSNTSGLKGVTFHRGKWRAVIRFKYRSYHLGRYDTAEAAAAAYHAKARELFGGFANAGD